MRLGIFGGTFNPIHMGHLITAEQVREAFDLDRMVFVPSARPPHKPSPDLIDGVHRLEMARLAVADHPRFDVSPIEHERSGRSYSVETVEAFRREWGREAALYFVLGIDAFLEIATWREPKKLFALCNFVINSRPGFPVDQAHQVLSDILGIAPPSDAQSIALPHGRTLWFHDVFPIGISSTLIRDRLSRGRSVKYLLPGPVESYILSHHLYSDINNRS
jgi:nicotinate-nucleotide adenylyltransferase